MYLATKRIDFDHFKLEKLLEQGTYSTVYEVTLANSGTESVPYALKQFLLRNSIAV